MPCIRSPEDKQRDVLFNQIRHIVATRCHPPANLSLEVMKEILEILGAVSVMQ
jgi:hypothetical protein